MIYTNNPCVVAAYPCSHFVNGSVCDVYVAVRNAIHKGAQLVSYPVSGSIKPNATPYKSVVITTAGDQLDFNSLQIIEDAINLLSRLPHKHHQYDESILEDFRIIDLDHLDAAIR